MDQRKTGPELNDISHPFWILILVTVSQAILLFIFARIYQVIHSIIGQEGKYAWYILFMVIALPTLALTGYAVICIKRHQGIHKWVTNILTLMYVAFLYLFIRFNDVLFPGNVPTWMISQFNAYLYFTTFLIPGVFLGIFNAVKAYTPPEKKYSIPLSFLFAVLIPLVWYSVFSLLFIPLASRIYDEYLVHIYITLMVAGTILFYFFLIRAIYLAIKSKIPFFKQYEFLWKIIFGLILPLFGLLLCNGVLWGGDFITEIFGDFTHYSFYVLMLITGIVISIPQTEAKIFRIILFVIRSLTICFSLYLFITFLPFYPLAVFIVIIFGLGFVIIAPLVLFVFHINILRQDLEFLQRYVSKKLLFITGSVLCLIIPAIIVSNFYYQRINLHKALTYVFEFDYTQTEHRIDINLPWLQKTLGIIRKNKKEEGRQIPYITPLFNAVVLNNLTLSDKKISYLLESFTGRSARDDEYVRRREIELEVEKARKENTVLKTAVSHTDFNEEGGYFSSRIDLVIENKWRGPGEYITYITLPPGAWINGYYLYVNGEKVEGQLAEKKSVLWVYQQIRRARRDPGIMYYVDDTTIALKVFPFMDHEIRKTGFEIMHLKPVSLTIDDTTLVLDDPDAKPPVKAVYTGNNKVVYLPQAVKEQLPQIRRDAYFHFILDSSGRNSTSSKKYYIGQIKRLLSLYPEYGADFEITAANYAYTTITSDTNWERRVVDFSMKGTFVLDKAIRSILTRNYVTGSDRVPVIVVLSSHFSHVLYDNQLGDIAYTYPDGDSFFHYIGTHKIVKYSLFDFSHDNYEKVMEIALDPVYVLELDNRRCYLPVSSGPDVVLTGLCPPEELIASAGGMIDTALVLEGLGDVFALNVHETEKVHRAFFQTSLKTGILAPVTSYIVLENEAQREMLRRKQKQVLANKKYLDASDEPTDEELMSEPFLSVLLVITCFIIIGTIIRKRRNRSTAAK